MTKWEAIFLISFLGISWIGLGISELIKEKNSHELEMAKIGCQKSLSHK